MDYTLKSMVNFAAPIHTQAEIEATQYIADADIDEMREELAQQRADRRPKSVVSAIESEAEPSIWKVDWPRFEAVMAAAADKEVARERMFHDSEFAERIKRAEELKSRIKEAQERAKQDANAHYKSLSETEIVLEMGIRQATWS